MAPRFSSTRFKSRRADLKTFALLSISDREQTKNIFAAVKADFFSEAINLKTSLVALMEKFLPWPKWALVQQEDAGSNPSSVLMIFLLSCMWW